ncbi:Uncharacterised protein [Shigella sonnei]|jgi:hypothetical protein|nr:Uncharacterised protein [Shigella sonnei]SRN44644.1 Uncharacterised protein [Shigella flexneri]CSF44192.1 Uncharacterised protein [Shigella sonnei]CSH64318.1 Uncharacterised protein [Shigella sonnei]CSP54416.1 Uncharacterised protein [Shigella sonnei]
MQLFADVILKPDKRFKNDAFLCLANRLKHRGIILLAVFQQLDLIAFAPATFHK